MIWKVGRFYRVSFAVILLPAFAACGRSPETPDSTTQAFSANAVTTTGGTADIYPVVFPATAEISEAARQAEVQGAALDALCALLEISPDLVELRPDGVGCPRPDLGDGGVN